MKRFEIQLAVIAAVIGISLLVSGCGDRWVGDWQSDGSTFGARITKQDDHYVATITDVTMSGDAEVITTALSPTAEAADVLVSDLEPRGDGSRSQFRFTMDDGDAGFVSVETSAEGGVATIFFKKGEVSPSRSESSAPPQADTSPPETSASHVRAWFNHSVRVSLSATDDQSGVAATMYRVDGGRWTKGTTIKLTAVGRHTIEYRSVDVAGNEEAASQDWVGIDKTPPITIALNSPSGVAGKDIDIKFEVKDSTEAAHVRIAIQGPFSKVVNIGAEPTNEVRTCSVKLDAGDYTYRILATDQAGNESRTPDAGQIHVTSPPPEHPTELEKAYYFSTGFLGHDDLARQITKAYRLLDQWPDWTMEDPFRRALIEKNITDLCNKGARAESPSEHFAEAQRLYERMLDSANEFAWALAEVNPGSSFAAWKTAVKHLNAYVGATTAWGDALSSAWAEAKSK